MTKLFKFLLAFTVCLFAALGLSSCSEDEENAFGSIKGVVLDALTNDYLTKRALVTLSPGNQSMTLRAGGTFSFNDLEPGDYTVAVTCDGYESQYQNVSVYAGMAQSVEFVLSPAIGTSSLELYASSVMIDYLSNEYGLGIRNGSNTSMNWEVYGISVPWLFVTPTRGTLDSGATAMLNISIDRSAINSTGAAVSTMFTIRADGSETSVPVTVRLTPGGNESQDDGIISGRIVDSRTQRGISNATIIVSPGNYTATSNSNGLYSVESLPPGQYSVTATHDDYATRSANVTVNSGVTSTANIYLDPVTSSIEVSPLIVDFGLKATELVTKVYNTGNGGSVSWSYGRVSDNWMTVSGSSSAIPAGGDATLTIRVDRDKMESEEVSGSFGIWSDQTGQKYTVSVKARKQADGTGGNEDYSSASVTSCDYRVEAQIVSCKRSGTSVVFNYVLTNTGMTGLNDWRIYPPRAISMISGGSYSRIWDNVGTEYDYPTITFRNKSTSGANVLSTSFPTDMPCAGSVTCKDVPSTATKLNVILGVFAYPNSQFNMAGTEISFRNVPIY